MESAGAKNYQILGTESSSFLEVVKPTVNLPFVPTFGVFDSEVTMTDANLRRQIHDIDI